MPPIFTEQWEPCLDEWSHMFCTSSKLHTYFHLSSWPNIFNSQLCLCTSYRSSIKGWYTCNEKSTNPQRARLLTVNMKHALTRPVAEQILSLPFADPSVYSNPDIACFYPWHSELKVTHLRYLSLEQDGVIGYVFFLLFFFSSVGCLLKAATAWSSALMIRDSQLDCSIINSLKVRLQQRSSLQRGKVTMAAT